jgi:hypothetical protein
MVAEVVHGAPYRFRDPARFSLAHGGKDRHPYPVPIKVYDETIRMLKTAISNGKLRTRRGNESVEALGRSGAATGAHRKRTELRGCFRRRTRRLACARRALGVRVGDRGRKDRANAGELIERLSLRGGKADEAIQEANWSLCSVMTPGLLRFARNDGIIKRGSHARQ